MKYYNNMLASASAAALAVVFTSPAFAAGTSAGTTITNNVSVGFKVGGFDQTAATASSSITVDRNVNVTVAEANGSTTQVSPAQTAAATKFTVTNLSNAAVDFNLTAAQPSGDNFDLTNVKIFRDTGNGVFDGSDTEITYLDEVAADATVTVFVVGDIPVNRVTGNVAQVVLTAKAHAAGGTGSLGTALAATAGANTAGVDTVLGDGAGATDSANGGDFSATASYTVSAANVTAAKTTRIVSDPVNGTTNPKAIPGATVEYCIAVTNAAGSATATDIAVTDTLPADVTYDSGFGIFINGTVVASVCQADGNAGGSFNSGTGVVSGTLSNIAANVTRTLYFRVTIN